jgi:hypothetical protein
MVHHAAMPEISLRQAAELVADEPGVYGGTYESYGRSARLYGTISVGEGSVRARKQGRFWVVSSEDVSAAVEDERQRKARRRQMTEDYRRGVLHGKTGTVRTDFGGYRHRDTFHFVWSDYEIGRKRSNGTWMCSTCMKVADTEHANPQCHRCADWEPCGDDCTLSRVRCATCGTSFEIGPRGLAV